MLIAQLSDPHIKSPGQLLYDRIDTAGYLERAVAHVLKLDPLPVQVYRFDPKTFEAGLDTHNIGASQLKIYSPSRTVADCFKFRNKIGLDIAVEALQLARERKKASNRELLHFARTLRVERTMQPYLQAVS